VSPRRATSGRSESGRAGAGRDAVSGGGFTGGYFLAVAGNIGVGKTELTVRLSEELGWAAYFEPVIQNPYLDAFYDNMARWSFHLQIYFLSERFKAQVEISRSQQPFIQDRTIYEDAEIFARTLHDQGSMTGVDYENYVALFHVLMGYLRKPDVILYLRASPTELMSRIAKRGRPSEAIVYLDNNAVAQDASGSWAITGNRSGFIYADGNLSMNAGSSFKGFIYCEGDMSINGNAWILGGIVCHGKTQSKMNGGMTVLYSADMIQSELSKLSGRVVMISWREL
jgi:deoxyadenosine/deoxycytidine kinase